jgi:hypothetical protein
MQWSDIPFRPSDKTLRQFVALWLLSFAGLACWHGIVRENTVIAWVLAGAALLVGIVGAVKPPLVRPIFVGWMILAFPIGWLISRIVLGLAFYAVFTPVALVFRLSGRDALLRRFRPEARTYWSAKPTPADVRSYFRQF